MYSLNYPHISKHGLGARAQRFLHPSGLMISRITYISGTTATQSQQRVDTLSNLLVPWCYEVNTTTPPRRIPGKISPQLLRAARRHL